MKTLPPQAAKIAALQRRMLVADIRSPIPLVGHHVEKRSTFNEGVASRLFFL
jgi:hypothetical protein